MGTFVDQGRTKVGAAATALGLATVLAALLVLALSSFPHRLPSFEVCIAPLVVLGGLALMLRFTDVVKTFQIPLPRVSRRAQAATIGLILPANALIILGLVLHIIAPDTTLDAAEVAKIRAHSLIWMGVALVSLACLPHTISRRAEATAEPISATA